MVPAVNQSGGSFPPM